VPEQRIQRIANQINYQNRERESLSPFGVSGKPNRARSARASDDDHQRNR
jgi:hypothetical protein